MCNKNILTCNGVPESSNLAWHFIEFNAERVKEPDVFFNLHWWNGTKLSETVCAMQHIRIIKVQKLHHLPMTFIDYHELNFIRLAKNL